MNSEWDNEERLVRYLLGQSSEAERAQLEEAFITDDELFQQLSALENELRYDYAQGKLTPQQRELFEKRFLTSPEEHRSVAQAKAILSTLANVKTEQEAAIVIPE